MRLGYSFILYILICPFVTMLIDLIASGKSTWTWDRVLIAFPCYTVVYFAIEGIGWVVKRLYDRGERKRMERED